MNSDNGDDLAILDQAIREVDLKLKVRESTIDRLLGQAFLNHNGARRAAGRFFERHDTAGLLQVLAHDSLQRARQFGPTNADYFRFWNRAAVQQALAELTPALQERAELADRQRDLVATHQREMALRMNRTPVPQRDLGRARVSDRSMAKNRR